VADQSDAAWANFASAESIGSAYDSFGRKIRSTTVAAGVTTAVQQFSYDALSRLDCTAVRMNSGVFASLPASACTASTEGTAGPDRISRMHYDVLGRRSSVTVGLGTASQVEQAASTYTSDGLLATLSDANSNRTTYEYDGFDRQAKVRYPSPSSPGVSSTTDYEQFSYNANSAVVRARNGLTTTSYFDGMERVNYKDLPGTGQDVRYSYDLQGRVLSAVLDDARPRRTLPIRCGGKSYASNLSRRILRFL
jgi:YD repeat-containing protein